MSERSKLAKVIQDDYYSNPFDSLYGSWKPKPFYSEKQKQATTRQLRVSYGQAFMPGFEIHGPMAKWIYEIISCSWGPEPSQVETNFFARFKLPEQRLMLAVLLEAMKEMLRETKRPTKIKRDAELWFASNNEDPFSFRWICKALGQNPNNALRILDEAKRKPSSPAGPHTSRGMQICAHGKSNRIS